ncbi:hypothetical protein ACWGJW_13340 [Streptomyces nigrescens]
MTDRFGQPWNSAGIRASRTCRTSRSSGALLLLAAGVRASSTVDGRHLVQARSCGTEPDTAKYAATMAGDCDLKFQGYAVFRFSHDELRDREHARPMVTDFFRKLLNCPPDGHP